MRRPHTIPRPRQKNAHVICYQLTKFKQRLKKSYVLEKDTAAAGPEVLDRGGAIGSVRRVGGTVYYRTVVQAEQS